MSGTPLGCVVPALHVQVTVAAHENPTLSGTRHYRFQAKVLGFDPGVVRLSPVTSRYSPVLPLARLDSLLGDGGHSIGSATLIEMTEESRVPFISTLGIRDALGTHWIPCEDIKVIRNESSPNGALTGFLIGAAMEVSIVIGGLAAWHNIRWGAMK